MGKSAPSLSFVPTAISYGTIDVGDSSGWISYHVKNKSGSYADAVNMSISFLGSYNASEAKAESWVTVSTSKDSTRINSVGQGSGKECMAPSVGANLSIVAKTFVDVPSGASSSGRVGFYLHHRYQYTG
jgi:hypothetical protein